MALIEDIECAGLNADKFGNLLYVDKRTQSIRKLKSKDILALSTSQDTTCVEDCTDLSHVLYSSATTETANNLRDITIEREYLYWTNEGSTGRHGSVHKSFAEPFINQSPFQTYENQDLWSSNSVSTNSHYLFYTGFEKSRGRDPSISQLFVQKKNGAGFYTRLNSNDTPHLKNPSAVLPYKDTLLLVANDGFISQLDTRNYPPTADDFHTENLIELT